MHIAGFGATHWSRLNRIVRTVFLETECQKITWGQTEGQTERQTERADDSDFRNYSMMPHIAVLPLGPASPMNASRNK